MSKEIFRRLVEINARVDGVMQRRWVEVIVDVGALAQAYGARAWKASGGRAQLANGAVVVNTVSKQAAAPWPNVPTGTREPSVDVNAGVNAIVGADNIWNNSSAGSLDRKGKK